MQLQRARDTDCEVALRRELHWRGLRYYTHRRPSPALRREADIVFPRARVAVFVDGCFWHGCPRHATWPKANADWWEAKIVGNRKRDRETDRLLRSEGWKVIRVWEHEDPGRAAVRVARAVEERWAS